MSEPWGFSMMGMMYQTVLGGIGVAARTWGVLRPSIFCFHSVRAPAREPFRSQLSVDEDFLERLILALRKLSIPILPLEEAVRRIRKADLRPFVVLTFDDGYIDNYTTLYPLMARWQVPFTIFVTTGLVDGTIAMWWDALERLAAGGAFATPPTASDLAARFKSGTRSDRADLLDQLVHAHPHISAQAPGPASLDWDMLREMLASGLLTVGSHTVHHPMLAYLDPAEIAAELSGSRARLEEMLDVPIRYLAYPFGQDWEIGAHAADVAGRAGYEAAFTTDARTIEAGDADRTLLLPRVLLSSKAVHPNIALAYMSGLPARLNRMAGR